MRTNDHEIKQYGTHLLNKRIAFVVSGGIAAYTAPKVIRGLRAYGADIRVFATKNALDFITKQSLEWASNNEVITELSSKSEHLSWIDYPYEGVVVYPATYNFIAKMANGIADDAASTLIAANMHYNRVIYFPAMHHNMYVGRTLTSNMELLDTAGKELYQVKPAQMDLKNNKVNVPKTRDSVCQIVRHLNPNKIDKKVVVTSGSTSGYIDEVRLITNKFGGKMGIEIANELYLQGADVTLLHSKRGVAVPNYLHPIYFDSIDEYIELCNKESKGADYFISAAAVTDYKPKNPVSGKLPSGKGLEVEFEETVKVVDYIKHLYPEIGIISFKFEMDKTVDEMTKIANQRVSDGHQAVIINCPKWDKDFTAFIVGFNKIGGYTRVKTIGKTMTAVRMAKILIKEK